MRHHAKGQYSKQAHVAIPKGLYEEEFGREGFYGPVSHLYHQHAPTGWSRIEGPLKPQAFNGVKASDLLPELSHFSSRVTLMYNADVAIGVLKQTKADPWFVRNIDGDDIFFVHKGQGQLESDFGTLSFELGDYLVIPKGTTYRLCPTEQSVLLTIQSTSRLLPPDRGLLGQHALYDPGVLVTPEPKALIEGGPEWEVRIKRQNQVTSVFYPYHPIDTVGWKGDLSVFKLNVRDMRPVMSHRMHLAPSIHTTLTGHGFVLCTFLPRPLESDPEAIRVPFYHRNIDYDEVLFYHAGDFFSRDGISPGMITLHPQGIHHGPHPNAMKASWTKTHTEEIAVMVDTVSPLTLTEAAKAVEWGEYWQSWKEASQ